MFIHLSSNLDVHHELNHTPKAKNEPDSIWDSHRFNIIKDHIILVLSSHSPIIFDHDNLYQFLPSWQKGSVSVILGRNNQKNWIPCFASRHKWWKLIHTMNYELYGSLRNSNLDTNFIIDSTSLTQQHCFQEFFSQFFPNKEKRNFSSYFQNLHLITWAWSK